MNRLPPEALGVLFFIGGTFLFSIMDVFARILTQDHDPLQVVWARYASQTVFAFILAAPMLRTRLKTSHPWLQVIRSVLLFGATMCFFSSFRYLYLAETMALFQVAPLLMTALAVVVLGESVGPRRWFGVAAGLLGALIIIRPGSDVFTWAALLPIGAAACFAGYSTATRFLGPDEDPWTSFLYTALFGAIIASVMVPFVWTPPDAAAAITMAGFGAIGGVGHFLLILAFARTPSASLAPFIYLGLVFGAFWGFAVFAEIPDVWTVTGALVIVGAGLYVWRRERIRAA